MNAYCSSSLARRVAGLDGVRVERPFAFTLDGVLLNGRLDVLWRSGSDALVLDYKTNGLDGREPAAIVEAEYRAQMIVYALACFRAGFDDVEVVYQFLEAPEDGGLVHVLARRRRGARARARRGDRADPRGRLPADAEPVRLLRLPGAGSGLRGAAPRQRAGRRGRARS